MKAKPPIVVSIPLVWGVRNVLRSGLYDQLAEHFRVILAAPAEGQQDLLREGIDSEDLWVLDHPQETPVHSRWMKVLKSAHARRYPTPSDHIFDEWSRHKTNGSRIPLRHTITEAAYKSAGVLAANPAAFYWLEQQEEAAYRKIIPRRTWDRLHQVRPIFGLSTCHVVNWEWALFRAMHALHIPIATHVLSFDNLTTRGYIPTTHFGHFLVWQDAMAGELRRFYGIQDSRITVTGTPQFDFHVREDFRWSRERTARELEIDPLRPYFLHCANHRAMTPGEPELLMAVLRAASEDRRFRNHQWIVRLHPLDDYQRWEPLLNQFPNLRLSRPWSQAQRAAFWGAPSDEELARLANSLRHADATLTMGSSTALDSAVVDTPIICIGFHPRTGSPEDRFYRESHFSHHYRPIMDSQAAPLAKNMTELLECLAGAVSNRGALREQRARLVAQVCGCVDGKSADRIAAIVLNLINARAIQDREPSLSLAS
jgi:hypothetical protein